MVVADKSDVWWNLCVMGGCLFGCVSKGREHCVFFHLGGMMIMLRRQQAKPLQLPTPP